MSKINIQKELKEYFDTDKKKVLFGITNNTDQNVVVYIAEIRNNQIAAVSFKRVSRNNFSDEHQIPEGQKKAVFGCEFKKGVFDLLVINAMTSKSIKLVLKDGKIKCKVKVGPEKKIKIQHIHAEINVEMPPSIKLNIMNKNEVVHTLSAPVPIEKAQLFMV